MKSLMSTSEDLIFSAFSTLIEFKNVEVIMLLKNNDA